VKYICGCSQEEKANYRSVILPNGEITHRIVDGEGYEICPEHGERLQGWKTIHAPGEISKPDYSKMGSGRSFVPNSTVKDIRDNRDPEEIGAQILIKETENGHDQFSTQI